MKPIGEMTVKINKKEYVLKATFEGLCEMEERAHIGIHGLSIRLQTATSGINDITSIIYGGIIGKVGDGKPPIGFIELGEEILKHGMSKLNSPCGDLVVYGMTGEFPEEEKLEKKKFFQRTKGLKKDGEIY